MAPTYKKLSFSTSMNTYRGTCIMMAAIFIFAMLILGFLSLAALGVSLVGGTSSGSTWLPIAGIIIVPLVWFFLMRSFKKEWPKCPKHGTRLAITSREDMGLQVLLTFECPEGDFKDKYLADKPSRSGRVGGRMIHGRGGGGFHGFHGGRSGGGGAGR